MTPLPMVQDFIDKTPAIPDPLQAETRSFFGLPASHKRVLLRFSGASISELDELPEPETSIFLYQK